MTSLLPKFISDQVMLPTFQQVNIYSVIKKHFKNNNSQVHWIFGSCTSGTSIIESFRELLQQVNTHEYVD
jgi:hypothetical protein